MINQRVSDDTNARCDCVGTGQKEIDYGDKFCLILFNLAKPAVFVHNGFNFRRVAFQRNYFVLQLSKQATFADTARTVKGDKR